MGVNMSGQLEVVAAIPPQSTAVSTVNGSDHDMEKVGEFIVEANIGTVDASTTLDIKLQDAPDDGAGAAGTYADLTGAVFTQMDPTNDVAMWTGRVVTPTRKWVRAVAVIGGAGSAEFAVSFIKGELNKGSAQTWDFTYSS